MYLYLLLLPSVPPSCPAFCSAPSVGRRAHQNPSTRSPCRSPARPPGLYLPRVLLQACDAPQARARMILRIGDYTRDPLPCTTPCTNILYNISASRSPGLNFAPNYYFLPRTTIDVPNYPAVPLLRLLPCFSFPLSLLQPHPLATPAFAASPLAHLTRHHPLRLPWRLRTPSNSCRSLRLPLSAVQLVYYRYQEGLACPTPRCLYRVLSLCRLFSLCSSFTDQHHPVSTGLYLMDQLCTHGRYWVLFPRPTSHCHYRVLFLGQALPCLYWAPFRCPTHVLSLHDP